jgi:glucose/arabinose dehydrogenase
MRKMMTALFALALAMPMLAFAQSDQQPMQDQQSQSQTMQNQQPPDQQMQDQKNSQAEQNQAASLDQTGQTTMPKHNMSGMVSEAGKSFTSDNKTYMVDNPKKLKNYDNQNVSVNFKFDTEHNTIHILSVSPAQ